MIYRKSIGSCPERSYSKDTSESFDAVIALDCGDIERLGSKSN